MKLSEVIEEQLFKKAQIRLANLAPEYPKEDAIDEAIAEAALDMGFTFEDIEKVDGFDDLLSSVTRRLSKPDAAS